MARDTPVHETSQAAQHTEPLPNRVTIVGRGVPSAFEITVDGDLMMVGETPDETATILSGNAAEGTIDVGVQRFRFSGQLANVHVVDWNGNAAPDSTSVPTVHVEYGVTN
ncbi:hypothetical protein [Natronosalvus vescus]|uniref:hypothetical protein n=1 Tax=Natronosalvus vescus TaxID=2953881 RepID=UPI002091A0F1|nr:hypothetical protein [Natronosalvus vescus]